MGEHAVEQYFAEIIRGGFGSNVAVVDNAAAHDGDAHAVRILFFRAELAHQLRDGDSFAAITWYVGKMDDGKSVGDFDVLVGASWSFAYSLAKAAYLIYSGATR